MFLWFLGLSFGLVLIVFSSPALDYRLVMFGSVLPVAERFVAGPWLLHTLLGPVLVLTLVMVGTTGRRLLRRQLLGLPIGLFMHLVLDGTWTTSKLFWWPVLGVDGILGNDGTATIAEAERGVAVVIIMEFVGAGALAFLATRLGLLSEGRDRFVSTGQLLRSKLDE
jgi:hypothetical protein